VVEFLDVNASVLAAVTMNAAAPRMILPFFINKVPFE
jgi:hypothetical protein